MWEAGSLFAFLKVSHFVLLPVATVVMFSWEFVCVCYYGKMYSWAPPNVVGTTTKTGLSTLAGVYMPVCLWKDFTDEIA